MCKKNENNEQLHDESLREFTKNYFLSEQKSYNYVITFSLNRIFIDSRAGVSISYPCNAVSNYNNEFQDFLCEYTYISEIIVLYLRTDYLNNNDILVELIEYNKEENTKDILVSRIMGLEGFQDSQEITFI